MGGVYSVTVTNAAGCTAVSTTTVTVNANPVPVASNTGPYCEGATIQLNVTAASSYSWSGPGGFTSLLQNPTRPLATLAMGGVYSVTVTNAAGCTAVSTTTVTVNVVPVAPTLSSNSPVCENGTLNLNASTIPVSTYSWTGPNGFTSVLQNPSIINVTSLNSGTYTVTPTSANGCIGASSSIDVLITPLPVVDAGVDQTVCASNPDVVLNGSVTVGATTGIWSSSGTGSFNPDNTTLNATYIPSPADISAGSINLTLTATGGCSPVNDMLVVTITPLPVVNAGVDITICSTTTTGNLSGTVTGGGSDGLGQWTTTGSGTFSPDNLTLNADYSPSGADITAMNIILILYCERDKIVQYE